MRDVNQQTSKNHKFLFKSVFPPNIHYSLENDLRCNAWRQTVYSITNPNNINSKKWKFRTPIRQLSKFHATHRYNAMGVHKIGTDYMYLPQVKAGFSKPQSTTLAHEGRKIMPPVYGTFARNEFRRYCLTGFRFNWIEQEHAQGKYHHLMSKTALIHSISTYDESTFQRGFYSYSQEGAQKKLSKRVANKNFFFSPNELLDHLVKNQLFIHGHNEVLARVKWGKGASMTIYLTDEVTGDRKLIPNILALIRQSDFCRRLAALRTENNEQPLNRTYKPPITFYAYKEKRTWPYTTEAQKKDIIQAKNTTNETLENLSLFLEMDSLDYDLSQNNALKDKISQRLPFMASLASSLTYESSQLFYTNFIRKNWGEISKYGKRILSFEWHLYLQDIFKCINPENLYGTYFSLKEETDSNVGKQLRLALFKTLHESGYTIEVEQYIQMLNIVSQTKWFNYKKMQPCKNQYLLKAIKKKKYNLANKLIDFGAKADYYNHAPNEPLALQLALDHNQKDLYDKMKRANPGEVEQWQADYSIIFKPGDCVEASLLEKSIHGAFLYTKLTRNKINENLLSRIHLASYYRKYRPNLRTDKLSNAIQNKQYSLALLIIKSTSAQNQLLKNKDYPLWWSISNKQDHLIDEIIKLGVDDNSLNQAILYTSKDPTQRCYLEKILKGRKNLDLTDWHMLNNLDRALHLAIKNQDIHTTKLLLKAGALLDVKNKNNQSPLDLALACEDTSYLNNMFDSPSEKQSNNLYNQLFIEFNTPSPRQKLITTFFENLSKLILSQDNKNKLLTRVIELKKFDLALKLLENGAKPNNKLSSGFYPLYWAIWYKQDKLVDKIIQSGVNDHALQQAIICTSNTPTQRHYLEKILKGKKNLDLTGQHMKKSHDCALHLAIKNQDIQTTELLLKAGALLDVKNKNDRSPLDLAIACEDTSYLNNMFDNPSEKQSNCLYNQLVIELNHPSPKKNFIATFFDNLPKLILKQDKVNNLLASVFNCNTIELETKIEFSARLLKSGASLDTKNSDGQSPLDLAVESHNENYIDMMLSHANDMQFKSIEDKFFSELSKAQPNTKFINKFLLSLNESALNDLLNNKLNSLELRCCLRLAEPTLRFNLLNILKENLLLQLRQGVSKYLEFSQSLERSQFLSLSHGKIGRKDAAHFIEQLNQLANKAKQQYILQEIHQEAVAFFTGGQSTGNINNTTKKYVYHGSTGSKANSRINFFNREHKLFQATQASFSLRNVAHNDWAKGLFALTFGASLLLLVSVATGGAIPVIGLACMAALKSMSLMGVAAILTSTAPSALLAASAFYSVRYSKSKIQIIKNSTLDVVHNTCG